MLMAHRDKSFTVSLSLCLLLVMINIIPMARSSWAAMPQGELGWLRVSTKSGEVSALMPSKPRVYVTKNTGYNLHGERIKEMHVAYAYGRGAVFIMQMQKAANPRRLLEEYLDLKRIDKGTLLDIELNGLAGKERVLNTKNFFSRTQYFTTKSYLYIIEVAARSESNPAVNRFLSSLQLGATRPTAANAAAVEDSGGRLAAPLQPSTEHLSSSSGLTSKAVIVWKPEPEFTQQAREMNIVGIVRLRVVLSASGEVAGIEVVKELGGGLTQEAIKAARHISFLPAEKEGRPVSQYITIEYMFSTY